MLMIERDVNEEHRTYIRRELLTMQDEGDPREATITRLAALAPVDRSRLTMWLKGEVPSVGTAWLSRVHNALIEIRDGID